MKSIAQLALPIRVLVPQFRKPITALRPATATTDALRQAVIHPVDHRPAPAAFSHDVRLELEKFRNPY